MSTVDYFLVCAMRYFFLTIWFTFFHLSLVYAQLNLAGTVTDEHDQPLAGAVLVIKGTVTGTTTLPNGYFTLHTDVELPLTLSVSFIGYRRKDVLVRGSNFRALTIKLTEDAKPTFGKTIITAASRLPEESQQAALTVHQLRFSQMQQSPAANSCDALQQATGVDLITQSLLVKSINLRGFGSTANSRLLQLNDGMDNRSPGLGFGFGNVAGIPDLDVDNSELVAGPSSALYGPDAEQGIVQTTSKNPFTYQGLSVQAKTGINNLGKGHIGPSAFGELAIRYARQLTNRLAVKVNVQQFMGTDFVADDYSDRSTRARRSFFTTDPNMGNIATGLGYQLNSNTNTNFQYDGVNIYGDDINAGGAVAYPSNYANPLLQHKLVSRTGYTELDVLGTNGKVANSRANVALHYKLPGHMEASIGWYYGNSNVISTTDTRNYFPNVQRHQLKAELRGTNFFLRAYTTQQRADGWSISQTATGINNTWKPLTQWAAEFGQAYIENKFSIDQSRATADRGRFLPGSPEFNAARDAYANTYNTMQLPGDSTAFGTRFRDNSALWHYEGMYHFTNLTDVVDLIAGASLRHYALNTGGTLVALQPDGSEYGITEYGIYAQASRVLPVSSGVSVKPTVALRYDKNQYLSGNLSPRVAAVATVGMHHFRASWQTAFHNPTPNQLFPRLSVGSPVASTETTGFSPPIYAEQAVVAFLAEQLTASQLQNQRITPTQLQPERMSSWEVGYNTQLQEKLTLDAFYFRSQYKHFITNQTVYQPTTGQLSDLSTGAYRVFQLANNSPNDVFVQGWGLSMAYLLGRNFSLSGNFAHQVGTVTMRDAQGNIRNDLAGNPIIRRVMSDPSVVQLGRNYFNSPANRYTISLSNPQLTRRLGATFMYRWTDKMWYEQGITAGDVWLPAWSSLDAQLSYRMPQLKSVVKLGGTNLLNHYYTQGYGLASIGGSYYISLLFDELMH